MDYKFRKEKYTSQNTTDNKSFMLPHTIKHATSHWLYINHSAVQSVSFNAFSFWNFLDLFLFLLTMIIHLENKTKHNNKNYRMIFGHRSPSVKFPEAPNSEKLSILEVQVAKGTVKNQRF